MGIACAPGVHQNSVQQTALGEGSIRECSQVLPLSWQGLRMSPMDPVTSEEQRMIRMLCCNLKERFLLLHPMPQVPQLNLRLTAAAACKVTANQVAEGWRATKSTKFILCLFSMSRAVLSENSQGLEGCDRDKVHVQRYFLRKVFYEVLRIGKGWSDGELS